LSQIWLLPLLAGLAAVIGFLLARAKQRYPVEDDAIAKRIDALLPQTQCAQCGFPGCKPYALAIAEQRADIDRCPPGGERTLRALAELLDRPVPSALASDVAASKPARVVARIEEALCIGCTLCIKACPVDAIVGAPKLMHTVLANDCTGCELCLPPCPMDCISLVSAPPLPPWRDLVKATQPAG
jgi:Na+-translocating ferredoxin:NAD+ oxidoreductase subunit B